MNCTQSQISQKSCPSHSEMTISVPELAALPCFAILLVLALKGGRHLVFLIVSRLYTRYRLHQMAIRFRQIDHLEHSFSLSSSPQEKR